MKKIVLALAAVAAIGIAGCKHNTDAGNNSADVNATANEANVDVNASANDAAVANLSGNNVATTNDATAATSNAAGTTVDTGAASNTAH